MATDGARQRATQGFRPPGGGTVAAATGDVASLRDAALIAVASDALLRVSEVAALDVADIAHEDDAPAA